jgi:hypothetical protein
MVCQLVGIGMVQLYVVEGKGGLARDTTVTWRKTSCERAALAASAFSYSARGCSDSPVQNPGFSSIYQFSLNFIIE